MEYCSDERLFRSNERLTLSSDFLSPVSENNQGSYCWFCDSLSRLYQMFLHIHYSKERMDLF